MPTIEFQGDIIELDDNGFLKDSSKWTREIAKKLSLSDGFKGLGDDPKQWSVLELLRDLHKKGMLPNKDGEILFLITKGTGFTIAKLHRLFGGLSIQSLLKWAGLPSNTCVGGV